MTLGHTIGYIINSLLASLEIPVIIDFLLKIIKILHEKLSNGIYLY